MTLFTSDLNPFNPHFSRWKSINLSTLLVQCLSIPLFIHCSNDSGPILLWTWSSHYHLTDLLSCTFHEVFSPWSWSLRCPHKQPRGLSPSLLPLPPRPSQPYTRGLTLLCSEYLFSPLVLGKNWETLFHSKTLQTQVINWDRLSGTGTNTWKPSNSTSRFINVFGNDVEEIWIKMTLQIGLYQPVKGLVEEWHDYSWHIRRELRS